MELTPKNPWKCFRGSFRIRGSFRGSTYVQDFVEVEAFVEVTSAVPSTTYFHGSFRDFFSMESSISSMEAFTDTSMEAPGIFFHGILQIFHGSFRESFHGSFHELPRKKQAVQETGFVCVSLGYSSSPG